MAGTADIMWFSTVPITIVSSGLVLYYDFGNTSCYSGSGTTINDLTANANTATMIGTPAITYSSSNGGILVYPSSNTTSYLSIPAATSINDLSALTVNLWVNPTTIINNPFFYKSDNNNVQGWWAGMETGINGGANNGIGFARVLSGTDLRYFVSMTGMNAATWVMVTITFDGVAPAVTSPNVHVYFNGVENTTVTFTANGSGTTSSDATQPLYFGRNDASTSTGGSTVSNLVGSQGITLLYNRVLSQTEITQNFNATRTTYGI